MRYAIEPFGSWNECTSVPSSGALLYADPELTTFLDLDYISFDSESGELVITRPFWNEPNVLTIEFYVTFGVYYLGTLRDTSPSFAYEVTVPTTSEVSCLDCIDLLVEPLAIEETSVAVELTAVGETSAVEETSVAVESIAVGETSAEEETSVVVELTAVGEVVEI